MDGHQIPVDRRDPPDARTPPPGRTREGHSVTAVAAAGGLSAVADEGEVIRTATESPPDLRVYRSLSNFSPPGLTVASAITARQESRLPANLR